MRVLLRSFQGFAITLPGRGKEQRSGFIHFHHTRPIQLSARVRRGRTGAEETLGADKKRKTGHALSPSVCLFTATRFLAASLTSNLKPKKLAGTSANREGIMFLAWLTSD